jgi:hypothetical protein
MVQRELVNYIKQCKDVNMLDHVITAELRKQGWGEKDIKEAFSEYNKEIAPFIAGGKKGIKERIFSFFSSFKK